MDKKCAKEKQHREGAAGEGWEYDSIIEMGLLFIIP